MVVGDKRDVCIANSKYEERVWRVYELKKQLAGSDAAIHTL